MPLGCSISDRLCRCRGFASCVLIFDPAATPRQPLLYLEVSPPIRASLHSRSHDDSVDSVSAGVPRADRARCILLFIIRDDVHSVYLRLFSDLPQTYQSNDILCIVGKYALQCRNINVSIGNQGGRGFAPVPVSGFPDSIARLHVFCLNEQSCLLTMFASFLPADALWNLAMAINVYLTLFKKYNAQQLKALEWRYHLMCYGAPLLVAVVYLFVDTPDRGRIYGPATVNFPPARFVLY